MAMIGKKKKTKRVALQDHELEMMLDDLADKGIPLDTIDKIDSGEYSVDKDQQIWNTQTAKFVKGTARPKGLTDGGGYRTVKSKHMDMHKILNIFDTTIRPDDWHEILSNWAEAAKSDHKAAEALFVTRFGKAPARVQLQIENTNSGDEELKTAYGRTRDRLDKLKKQIAADKGIHADFDNSPVENEIVDISDYNVGPRVKVKTRKRQHRSGE